MDHGRTKLAGREVSLPSVEPGLSALFSSMINTPLYFDFTMPRARIVLRLCGISGPSTSGRVLIVQIASRK